MLFAIRRLVLLLIVLFLIDPWIREIDWLRWFSRFLDDMFGAIYGIIPRPLLSAAPLIVLWMILGHVISRQLGTGGHLGSVKFRGRSNEGLFVKLRGKVQNAKLQHCFSFRELDFAIAFASGWLKILVGVAIIGVPVVILLTEEAAVPALIIGVIGGAIVLGILLVGRIQLSSSSGHSADYFGSGAGSIADISSGDLPFTELKEGGPWSRRDIKVNLANISALIVGRRFRWGWLILGALMAAAPFLVGDLQLERLRYGVDEESIALVTAASLGTIIFVVGLILSFVRRLLVEFIGGAKISIYGQENIEKVLTDKDQLGESQWISLSSGGLSGRTDFFFNREFLAVLAEGHRIHWLLFLISIAGFIGGIQIHPGLVAGAVILFIVAMILSQGKVTYALDGGFAHSFSDVKLKDAETELR